MHPPLNSIQFRRVMSQFVTGVTIVTGRDGEEIHGMTCNSFCSISINPLTVMVSLCKNTRTEKLVERGRAFAVNVLSQAQADLSNRFAGRDKESEDDRFAGFDWITAVTGAPIFKGTQAYLDCKLLKAFDGGSHSLCLGEVVAAHAEQSQRPLIFFQSRYLGLDSLIPIGTVNLASLE
jgi:3-hydroxy-9,10-secoandrosta-1,3,5(10)-triene-9,17-dione monooxygenase reductase component